MVVGVRILGYLYLKYCKSPLPLWERGRDSQESTRQPPLDSAKGY